MASGLNVPFSGDLFSQHFLINRLPHGAYWSRIEGDSRRAFEEVKELCYQYADTIEKWDEDQLEEDFLKPILRILDHVYDVQPRVISDKGIDYKPDYALFDSQEKKEKAKEFRSVKESDAYFRIASGIAEAKKWNLSLDGGRGENPSVQLKKYLKITEIPWGILTNGRLWRIYSKKVGFSSNVYYEIDLPKLLERGDEEGFKYFYGFFSHAAFKLDGEACFLDRVYEESIKFSKELEDDLRDNVYEALKLISEGFIQKNPGLRDDLEHARTNTLIFLYRLLFIFYAESRGLLPLDNEVYKGYSLESIREEIADKKDRGESITLTHNYWDRLKHLFDLLDRGSKEVIGENYDFIPPYNGGLFKKDLYPFFDENELLDNYLAEGIELLSRRRGEGGKGYVDYSSLSIRHLGSIYEGLLEYKLRYAETDLAIEVDRGKEIYREAEEGEEVAVSKGDIYRVTDKGERKATGSYYTPDYIVKYIVENTVGPIVDERIDKAEKESKEVVDYLLGIKILDPAMGSGHFLVEATNFLSHRIIEYMQDSGSYEEIPDLNEMKRKVVEKSIYGIDMNPLAVELAKVSLWLDTVSKYKALSFLDHHLQCGNSLIGAGFEDIIKALPTKKRKKMKGGDKISSQITLFGSEFSSAVRDMIKKRMEIESLPSDTAMDMRKKERLHEETKVLTQRFKEILDIHTSQFFGNKASPGEFYNLIVYIKSDSGKWGLFKRKTWFQDAMKISKEKEFFNWELSFPEIFFDEYGSMKDSPGFDAVIGNPPYINLNWISPKIRWVLKDLFPDLWMGQADLYYFFIGQSLNKLKNLGQFSFIVSRYFIESHFAAGLRSLIAKEFNLQKIIDFRNEEIFPEIGIDSAIIHIENSNPKEKSAQIFYPKKNFDVSKPIEFQIKLVSELTCEEQNKSPWSILTFDERRLLDKVKKHSYLLKKEFVAGKGYETGLNDLYTITKEEIKKYNLKKNQVRQVVSNSEIHSYYFSPLTKYWIYLEDTNEEEFKNNKILYNLFLKNEDRLKNRLAYKRGDCLWYRYNYPRYIKEFHKPKLMTSYLSEKNAFQLDEKGRILGSTDVFIIAPQNKPKENLKYLLAILNSKLLTRIYRFYGKLSGGGVYSYSKHSLNLLPIRNIKFDTNKNVRSQLYEQLIRLFKNFDCEQIMEVVESLIPIDSKRNIVIEQEKSDVVHDFLAFLAEQMIEMKKKEHKLDGALDLFKYLPFDLQVQKFRWLFDEEIKYGRVINNEILKKFHDLNDFWLEKEGDEWILMAELKLRDDQNPKNFLKEGSKIKKEWRKLYAFDMDDEKAEYYKAIFENLFKFENSKIPSGYKKRVKEKLFQSQLPVFDEDKGKAIAPYLEIYTELSKLLEKIEKTDWLIDQIVYKLYGLTEEEIRIVEELA